MNVESEMIDEPKPPTEVELKAIEQRLDTEPINAYSCTTCGAVNHRLDVRTGKRFDVRIAGSIPTRTTSDLGCRR